MNAGGSAITSFTVTSNPGNLILSGAASPITVSGLTNGTAYVFTVSATNAAGPGAASAPSSSVIPSTVPGAPQNVVATAGDSQASVSFSPPAVNGGASIIGYIVTSSPGGLTASGPGSPLIVTGLSNGTAYTFSVMATNGAGAGSASAPSGSATPQTGVPGAPQSVHATGGDGQATVSFAVPATTGSSPIVSYTVTASPGGQTVSGAASPLTMKGLSDGTAYTFVVAAANASGTSASSASSNGVTPAAALAVTAQASFPVGMVGSDYPLQILTATGGVAPYTFAIANGNLPGGLVFSSPQFNGIPAAAGNFSFAIVVTDAAGNSASGASTISINPAHADLIISQSVASFSLTAGASAVPSPASVTVRSSVVQQLLNYSVSASPAAPWLALTKGGTTPGSIGLTLVNSALSGAAANTLYQTAINVTCLAPSPCAGNVQTINVSLNVTAPPPQLSATNSLLSFEAVSSNLAPASAPLGLQNSGGGTLTIESVAVADNWLSVSGAPNALPAGQVVPLTITVNPAGLTAGYYLSAVTIDSAAGALTIPVSLSISASPTMSLGPAGMQFQSSAGSAPGNTNGAFRVIVSGNSAANWTAAALPGSPWLNVSTSSGTASADTPGMVSFSIDPQLSAGLAANPYYATIRVSSNDAVDSPLDFGVILNVLPAATPVKPDLSPGGLVFVTTAAGGSPAPQNVQVYASSNGAVSYQASTATTNNSSWLSVNPPTGTVSSSAPGLSSVSVNSAGLAPGVYTGGVSYALSSAAVRTVNVTLVVPHSGSSASSFPAPAAAQPACVATKLVPTQIALVDNFEQLVGWPSAVSGMVLDDCGVPAPNAQVVASFSNGDAPLTFTPIDNYSGVFAGTWTPRSISSQATVGVSASSANLQVGLTQVTGQVATGSAPVLALNGALHAFNPQIGGALAPGTVVSIYGSNLASGISQASGAPLPTSLGGTSVLIGGIAVPLFYAAPGQINVQVPFELAPGNQYQVQVNNGGSVSTPDSIRLTPVSPGMAVQSGVIIAQRFPDNSLISEANPAKPGDYLTIYLVGLGATDQPVATGAAAPGNTLVHPLAMPTLTLNGNPAPVAFAGLTPLFVGLYQINFQIPANTPDGDLNLVVNQAGVASNTAILPVKQ